MTTRPRRCFADSAHESHEWRTFGAGKAGVWRCDGIPEGEAIVLTRPHVVAEFFHLDWTSQARRKLGVPVLHLLEHQNFDEQAEGL